MRRLLPLFAVLLSFVAVPSARAALANAQASDLVLGQNAFNTAIANNTSSNGSSLSNPSGVFVVTNSVTGSSFTFVADYSNHRVLIYKTTSPANGQVADFVLGQQDMFHGAANYAGITAYTLNGPRYVYSDGVKLFVTDYGNHRVLVWNTIPSTNTVPADVVIGQTTMSAGSAGSDAIGLANPGQALVVAGKLYVADQSNHRVKIYNTVPAASGASADNVIGQSRLSGCVGHGLHSNCAYYADNYHNNASSTTLWGASNVYVSTVEGRTYVSDINNNRVLVYLSTMPTFNTAPAFVLGQPDFEKNECNYGGSPTAQTLCAPRGIWSNGAKLAVTDFYNSRVLIWNLPITANQQAADVVVGQANKTSNGGAYTTAGMYYPTGVAYDAPSNQFYVSCWEGSRVMVYNGIPAGDGASAIFALGQNGTNGWAGVNQGLSNPTASTLYDPTAVFVSSGVLYVSDTYNYRVLLYSLPITANAQPAFRVLGQPDFVTRTQNNGGMSSTSLGGPTNLYVSSNTLFVSDTINHRILVWTSSIAYNQQPASFVVGQASMNTSGSNQGGLNASSLSGWWDWPGMGVWASTTTLAVSDALNNRVLYFSLPLTGDDPNAYAQLGQPGFTYNDSRSVTNKVLYNPNGLASDGGNLYVADTSNHRVLVFPLPVTGNQPAASYVLGQSSFTFPLAALAPGASGANWNGVSGQSMFNPYGVAVSSEGSKFRLYVGDTSNHRVLVWTSSITSLGQSANFSLGQTGLSSNACNNGGVSNTALCNPQNQLWADATSFWTADWSNNRALQYKPVPDANSYPASAVLGQDVMTTNGASPGASPFGMNTYWGQQRGGSMATDGTRLAMADTNNHRILIWNTKPTSSGQGADIVLGQPNMSANQVNNGGVNEQSFNTPISVLWDGRQFFVSEWSNNRVKVWNGWPTVTNQPANFVIGQNSFANTGCNAGGLRSGLCTPNGMYSDGSTLWIAEYSNNRVVGYDLPITGNQPQAAIELGQPAATAWTTNGADQGGISTATMRQPQGVYFDGERLFVSDSHNHRVLVWATKPTVNGQPADYVLGQPDGQTNIANNGGPSPTSMYYPTQPLSDGVRLYVPEFHYHTIQIYNSPITAMRQGSDVVLGTRGCGPGAPDFCWPTGTTMAGSKLWVFNSWANRILRFSSSQSSLFNVTITSGMAPATVTQGTGAAALKLVVNAPNPGFPLTWNKLTVYNNGALPGNSVQVRLYKDTGNGTFEAGGDTPIGALVTMSGVNSKAVLNFSQSLDTNYATYFVAVFVNPASLPYGPSGFPSASVRVYHNFNSFGFSDPAVEMGGDVPVGVAYNSGSFTPVDAPDYVAFSATSTVIPNADHHSSEKGVLMASLTVGTTNDWAFMNTLAVNKTGTSAEGDIAGLTLWRDVNGNGAYDGGDVRLSASTVPFGGGQAFLSPSSPLALSTTPVKLLILADFAGTAVNTTFGINITTQSFLLHGVDGASIAASTTPFDSPMVVLRPAIPSVQSVGIPTGTWHNSTFTFTGNLGALGVSYFRHAFDQNTTHVWSDGETLWTAGNSTVTAAAPGQNWWFHTRAYNASNQPGGTIDIGPYWLDDAAPSGSDFRHFSSTAGSLGETQWNDLTAAVTAQLTVQDSVSGLNLSLPREFVPNSDTRALWHMNEGVGTTVADASGNGRNGTVNSALWALGKNGTGLAFSGTGVMPLSSPVVLGSSWTIQFWFKAPLPAGVNGIGYTDKGEVPIMAYSGSRLLGEYPGATTSFNMSTLSNGWHFMSAVGAGGTQRFFIDGAFVGQVSTQAYGSLSTIGGLTTEPWGTMDELRVLGYAAGDAQIAKDYSLSRGAYVVEYSTNGGYQWNVVDSSFTAPTPYVELAGPHATTAPRSLKVYNLDLAPSTNTIVCAEVSPCAATNQIRFFPTDAAGNGPRYGPFALRADTPVHAATPTLVSPQNGGFSGQVKPTFFWLRPSTAAFPGLSAFYLEVSSYAVMSPLTIFISTPIPAGSVNGSYVSTTTLAAGTTYYWRVRAQSFGGVFGPYSAISTFQTDFATPTASNFVHFGSTAGALADFQFNDLFSGVTAQITVQDGLTGLNRASPPDAGTPALWQFEEGVGAASRSSYNGGNPATFLNGASFGTGQWGKGLQLDGVNDYASVAHAGNINLSGAITVSAWIKPGATLSADTAIVNKGAANFGWSLEYKAGQLVFAALNGTALTCGTNAACAPATLSAGAWSHVVGTFDNVNTLSLYLNGQLLTSIGYGGGIGINSDPLLMGSRLGTSNFFNGVIDDVRLSNSARTPAQIQADANGATPALAMYSNNAGASWTVTGATFPVTAGAPYLSVTGANASNAAESYQLRGFGLVQSTSSFTGGLATNQVKFLISDIAGNLLTAGPYGILFDTAAATALSTPTAPASGLFLNAASPTFYWNTPAIPSVTQYELDVSSDPGFGVLDITITTPAVAGLQVATYTATASLGENTTYYWRVRTRTNLNRASPWSAPFSFVTDFTSPAASGYLTYGPGGAPLAEASYNSLSGGVTAQLGLQDLASGLAGPVARSFQPLARYELEEGFGLSAADSSGNGNGGALSSAGLWNTAGYLGGGLSGNGGYVQIPTPAVAGWGGLTVMAWVKPTVAANYQSMWSSSQYQFIANGTGGTVSFYPRVANGGGCAPTTPAAYALNAWHHVAFVVDPALGQNQVWVNGALAASCAGAGTPVNTNFRLMADGLTGIGGLDAFGGKLDEVSIATVALTAAQIQSNYSRTGTFLVLYSTTAGSSWIAANSTAAAASPRLDLSGTTGSSALETFRAIGLNFGQSTNTAVCGGVSPCAATNMIRFLLSDRAGNIKSAGPYAVRVDTTSPVAISTAGAPQTGEWVPGQAMTFLWNTPSTSALSGLRSYTLEASLDPAFGSLAVSVSTPQVGGALAAAYVSTFTLAEGSSYYWRVRAMNDLGNYAPYSAASIFVVDSASPAASNFAFMSSTGGLMGETQALDLFSGVTVQLTVQDTVSGLAGAGYYGVSYSTNAGASWIDYSTYSATALGQTDIRALAGFGGNLFAGTGGGGQIHRFDGAWSGVLSGTGETSIHSLASFKGKLYAGSAPSGKVFSSVNGTVWDAGTALAGATQVLSLAVFNGKLYAGTTNGGAAGKVFVTSDGASWSQALAAENQVFALAAFNGRLFAGTAPAGRVYATYDGRTWTSVQPDAAQAEVRALAVYNGRLYAATASPAAKVYSSADGDSWIPSLTTAAGETSVLSLAAVNGKLYAGTAPSAKIFAFAPNGAWTEALRVPGETDVLSLFAYAGKLYAGTSPSGKVLDVSPLTASLSGAEGDVAARTLTGKNLNLVQSTNTLVCAGVFPCGATNQVRFTVSDRAGLVRSAGPFAVLVDTVIANAQPIPGLPDAIGASGLRPEFAWAVSPAISAADLSHYRVDVSLLPDFSSLEGSTSTLNRFGSLSFNLTNATTYYWRVRAFDVLGASSSFSPAQSLRVDVNLPAASAFATIDSTGGITSETMQLNLASGVTAQLTVLDIESGIGRDGPAPLAPVPGTVLLWHLDAGAGAAAADAGRLANAGAVGAGAAWTTGRFGKALRLDGTAGSAVTLAWNASLDLSSATLEAWINSTDGDGGWIVNKTGSYGLLLNADGTASAQFEGAALNCAAVKVNDGRWHHLAAAYDAGTARIYADGVLCGSGARGAIPAGATGFAVGQQGDGAGPRLSGAVDDVRVLSRALTAAQAAADYATGNPFTAQFSTTSGAGWTVVTSTAPGAAPYLSFNGSQYDLASRTLSLRQLSLAASTGSQVCGEVSPCGATNQIVFTLADRAGNIRTAGPFAVLVDTFMTRPSAVSPADASWISSAVPQFGWREPAPAQRHEIYVSTDPAFATLTYSSITANAFARSLSALDNGGVYYWKVRAIDSINLVSPFSPTNSFTVDLGLPAGGLFSSISSTGGVIAESQFNDLAAGVTAQVTVQDVLSGLAGANSGGLPGTGTIGLWRFDAGSGSQASDASGLGNSGALAGGAAWTAGRYGYAISATGGGSVEVPYAAALNTPGAMTVEAWIRTSWVNPGTSASGQGVVSRENAGGFSLNTGRQGFGGGAAFSVGYPTWLVGSTPVNDGLWHHVAATYDGAYARLYVDGVQDAFAAAPNGLSNTFSPLSIGRSPNDAGATGFTGDIDEVHLLNYARTPAEILADYRGYSFTAEISTNAGASFTLIRSTYASPAGAPYVAVSGAAGSTAVETLQARNLTLAASTTTATGALATNQVKFSVTDRAGNSKAFGPFGIVVDTVMSQPLPRSPADSVFVTTAAPVLTWSEKSLVALHLVQVSTDPAFATLSWSTATTSSYAAAPALTENVTYYWRLRSQNAVGVQSPFSPANSFVIDLANPTASLFRTVNSTAGVLGESAINNLASGVTAQIKVQDLVSGLALGATGYSVMYSTNAGQTWRDGAWTSLGAPIAGETELVSMAVYNGKLYAGTSAGGKVAVFDGTAWTATNGNSAIIPGETYVFALAVHGGKLYAGTYPGGKVAVYDGVSWSATNGGLSISAGETEVHALASFNGKLYAGTMPGGKVIAFDGTSWAPTNSGSPVIPGETQIRSLAEYNGRLYAGTATGGKVASFDGFTWTATNGGAAVIPGETYAVALAAYNGKLMAGTYPNGKVASFDGSVWSATAGPGDQYAASLGVLGGKLYAGTIPGGRAAAFDGAAWTAANAGAPVVAGETGVRALAAFGGALYAGTAPGGKAARLTPEPASLTGSDGSLAQQTLSAVSLNLAQSTNTTTCAGVSPCGATNQVMFTISDRAGLVRTAGPYAIIVDSTPPVIDVTSLTPSSNTIFVTALGADYPAGVRDYNFEASSSPLFAFGVSSTNFISASTYTFTNLPGGTTYYVRVTARDQVFNVSAPSVVRATTTLGSIFYVGTDVAPASAVQGSLISAVRFTLNTNPLETGSFTSLRVRRTGTATDADVAGVKIYLDSVADGVFNPGQDTEIGSAVMSGGMALVNLGGNAQPVTSTPRTFFVVYQLHSEAVVGDTIGARILSVSDVGVTFPFAAYGAFPSDSGLTAIADGSNTVVFTPTNLAPATASPGASQVAMLKLSAQTNTGTSIMNDMVLYLTGSLASNQVSGVRVYRDANANGVFDPGADDLLTSGADFFVGGVSTLTFTAPQSSRTVTIVPVPLFVVLNVAGSAPIGDTFAVRVATPSQVRVANAGDAVAFSVTPMASNVVTVQTNNTVTVAMASQGPAVFSQGFAYSVVAATMTVDIGLAQIDRILVNRTGNGVDADVALVKVYRDLSVDGGAFNPAVDLLIGSATFSGGLATVDIATATVNAGTPAVFFLVYAVDSLANPGNTLGMSLSNVSYVRAVSPLTTVAGAFPFSSSTGTIVAAVNTLLLNVLDQTPGGLLQGATNISLLRVTANAGTNSIPWSGLSIARLGTGLDTDVQSVRIYRDENADGLLQTATDTLVTSGLDAFAGGTANLAFNTAQIVTTSTRTYFVAVNVNANAAPGNQIGVRLSTTASFNLNPPNIVSAGPPSFPIDAGPAVINQFPNSVSVATTSLTPAGGANPGTLNVPVMQLRLATDVSSTQLMKLRLDRAGSSLDSDVTAVKVYYDINGLGAFNPGALAQYLLVTSSTLTFGAGGTGTVELGLNPVQGITTAGKTYFVVVDLATGAVPGRTVVVRSLNQGYYAVDAPNTLAPTSFSAAPLTITAPPSSMYALAYASAPASAVQGASNVVMLSLGLWMKSFTGSLSQLTITRSGSGQDSDVSRIKLYQDANANGTLDIGFDTQLTSGVFSGATASLAFAPQTLTVSTKTFFLTYDFSTTAQGGDTVGALIGSPGAFTIAAPNGVSSQGIPIQSANTLVVPTMNGVTLIAQDKAPAFLRQAATGQHMLDLTMNTTSNAVLMSGVTFKALGTASDADVVRLRVFYDADNNGILNPALDTEVASLGNPFVGGTASVNFTPAQPISAVSRRYMVSVDMKDFADSTKTFGVSIASAADMLVPSPNYVVNSGFPVNTSVVPILKIPDTLMLTPSSLLAADAIQSTELLTLKVRAVSSRARSTWTSWKIGRLGTLADNLIDQVRVYKDSNGSGAWDAGDLLIGTGTFAGGSTTVAFSSAQTVGVSTETYFVGLKINLNATVGATVGASIQDNSYFTVTAPDAASGAGLPFLTPLVSVMDAKTPTQPVIVMPDGPFSASFESIRFNWNSSVVLGGLTTAYYCIGTTPGGTQVRGWQGLIPVPGTVTVPGLLLATGTTYYVSVKAGSSYGFTSAVGMGAGQLVDALVPNKLGAGSALVGDKSVVVNWGPVPAGPSGIAGYLVEFRRGDSPRWQNAKTYGTSSLSVAATTVSASALVTSLPYAATTVPAGTLYFRASAVTGAGVPGDPSDPIRVQFGGLPASGLADGAAYPNPFDSRKGPVNITYVLAQPSEVKIEIYSIYGAKVRELSVGGGVIGSNTTTWDGADSSGQKVSKGMYIAVLSADGTKTTLKIGVIH